MVSLAGGLGADVAVDGRRDDVLAAIESFAPEGLDGAPRHRRRSGGRGWLRGVASTGRIAWAHGVNPPPSADLVERVSFYDGDRSREALQRLNEVIESSLIARTWRRCSKLMTS